MNHVVIAGVAEVVAQVPEDLATAASPLDLMAAAAQGACADSGGEDIPTAIDAIAVVRSFSDTAPQFQCPFGGPMNAPRAIAARIGAAPRMAVYSAAGGQAPEALIHEFAGRIARGECETALLVGGEALANQKALRRARVKANWSNGAVGQLDDRGSRISEIFEPGQIQNGLRNVPAVYGLMENARRAALGLSRAEYGVAMSRLFARFSEIAATQPGAMFPHALGADQIATASADNPMIAEPYTRAMVAKDGVNQAAAVLMMSEARADALGLARERRVYPRAGAETAERTLSGRAHLFRSVAMTQAYHAALDEAGLDLSEIGFFDLYSCFPVAVFAAAEALGLDLDDPRGLTLTGGLPFFGGPGNNYSMHAVVAAVRRLREAGSGHALVGANGGFMSKHAVGVYSAAPPPRGWSQAPRARLQAVVDAQPTPLSEPWPHGRATVESYTVDFDKNGPTRGFIMGRLQDGRRFLAASDPADRVTLGEMLAADPIGRRVYVTGVAPGARFVFAPAAVAWPIA